MKIVNKNNGCIVAKGRFELSKISDMEINTEMGADTWVSFRYFCDNLIIKKGSFNFLAMVAEITLVDNLISVEASGDDYDNATEIRAEAQLTEQEREHLFVHIINLALDKAR